MSETVTETAPEADDLRSELERNFEAITSDDGPARDEKGRFAPKQAETVAEEPEAVAPEEPEAPAETPEATEEPEQPAAEEKPEEKAAEPPATWRAADKEMFAKAPKEAQEFLLRRHGEMEADYTRKNMQRAALIRDFEPVRQMFEPYAQTLRERNMTPAALIQGWYHTETALLDQRQAPDMVARIIKGYNIDPTNVLRSLGYQPPPQSGDAPPPAEQTHASLPPEIQNVLQQVVAKVETFEQAQRREREIQQQHATQRVVSEIDRFANEKDQSGALVHPHFKEVEDDMALIADSYLRRGGDIPPLKELYETAVWANPITRARVQQEMTAAQEAQRTAADRRRAEEARARTNRAQRAAAPVSGAPRTGQGDPREVSELSLREQLERAYADLAQS